MGNEKLMAGMEMLCPGITENLDILLIDALAGTKTAPKCIHGNAFCDEDWLPVILECGCRPNMGQIYLMTHYALS